MEDRIRDLQNLVMGLAAAAFVLLVAVQATALEAGDRAPHFAARALHPGDHVSLADYRGKVVYLDFWASWCAPCLTSLPMLEKLRREFSAADFQIVAVNLDRDLERARRFLEKHPVGYPSASDPQGAVPESFGVETMPTSFLIDRDGVIRHVHKGFRASDIDGLRERIALMLGGSR